jgi:rRNA maturation endonuclease Nob1
MTDFKFCVWREDEYRNWETKCGRRFVTLYGTPKDNDFERCPFCGRKLKQTVFKEKDNV